MQSNTILAQIRAVDPDLNSKLVYSLIKNNNQTITNDKVEAFDESQRPVDFNLIKVKLYI